MQGHRLTDNNDLGKVSKAVKYSSTIGIAATKEIDLEKLIQRYEIAKRGISDCITEYANQKAKTNHELLELSKRINYYFGEKRKAVSIAKEILGEK